MKKNMVENKITLFKDFHCRKCGSAENFVYESTESICIKCNDCNDRTIFSINERKEGARQELELVEDTLLGIIMLESEPAKILTEFRVWLQERKGK